MFHKVGVKDRFELALYGLKNLTAAPNLDSPGGTPSREVDYGSPLRSLVIGTARLGPLADSPAR